MYKYAFKQIRWPKNYKKCSLNEKKIEKYKKIKIKISPLKFPLHETNYAIGKHCLRSTKTDAFCIEIRALVITNKLLILILGTTKHLNLKFLGRLCSFNNNMNNNFKLYESQKR